MTQRIYNRRRTFLLIGLAIAILLIGFTGLWFSRFNPIPQLVSNVTPQPSISVFPTVDETSLSDSQRQLLQILKNEFESQPSGTKYSEGVNEAWCADFVSWVYKEANMPFENPHSGSWRIPGTYTLREYYEASERFVAAGSEYTPVVGDLMFYDNPSPFGQHVNIVIQSKAGVVTTIGGNEPGGIRIVEHTNGDGVGFLGYGTI